MSGPILERVKKYNNYLFINVIPSTPVTPSWGRVGKSTEWTDNMNPATETFDYIEDTAPTDELSTYKPSTSVPHTAYIGDPVYDFIFELYRKQATGSDAVTQLMKVFQQKNTAGANLALTAEALITIDNYNFATGILTYTVTQRGTPTHGTARIAMVDDVPTPEFTPDSTSDETDDGSGEG